MSESPLELQLADANATDLLGAALGHAYWQSGRGGAVLYLHGELGAGKTTSVRSLLRTLGVGGLIRSPTYTLVETYELQDVTCIHVDLYRIQGPVEVDELGLREALDGECLLLVEWPERGGAALPPADVHFTMSYAGESRQARLEARTDRGRRWLDNLAHDRSLTPYLSNIT